MCNYYISSMHISNLQSARRMPDRNRRRLGTVVDTLAAMDAGKTGCDHCHGRGFCHNSQMEHDMPKEDTWLHVYWQKKGMLRN